MNAAGEALEDRDEDLPFALPHDADASSTQQNDSPLRTSSFLTSSATFPPGLSSSLISNPTDGEEESRASESPASSMYAGAGGGHSSLFQPHFLDAAASLLHPASSLFNLSLISPPIHDVSTSVDQSHQHQSSSFRFHGEESLQETILSANDPINANYQQTKSSYNAQTDTGDRDASLRLPVLPEDQSVASNSLSSSMPRDDAISGNGKPNVRSTFSTPYSSSESCGEVEWLPCSSSSSFGMSENPRSAAHVALRQQQHHHHLQQQQQSISQTIVPAGTTATSELSSLQHPLHALQWFRTPERRLASLAGATATRTGPSSFDVSLDLAASCRNVSDVMDVLGNPDLLRLWCDALPPDGFIITQRSEGSVRSWQQQQSPPHPAATPPSPRQYEGEWVEATTAPLVVPPRTSCWYSAGRAVSGVLGCPTYGRVTMFVERQKGQVGLTLGPFPGHVQVWYKLRVEPTNGRIRIVNQVRVDRDELSPHGFEGATVSMCGLWEAVQQCLLPTIDDYMDQVLSSTARLRFLVENGETSLYVPEPPLPFHRHGVSTAPLLSVA